MGSDAPSTPALPGNDAAQRFERAKAAFLAGLQAQEAGDPLQAETLYQESLRWQPGRPSTLVNLAGVQLQLRKPQEALRSAEAALAAEPGSSDAQWRRATALAELGRPQEALQAVDQVLATVRDVAEVWMVRGNLAREMHMLDEAAASFERALALGADPGLASFHLAAVRSGDAVPQAPPQAWVQTLFDAYAPSFDHHLVQSLQYRAHDRLVELLALGLAGQPAATAIDLGCGTGLAGPGLRPLARRLVGVDLSAGMLAQAQRLGVYDRLEQAELAAFLSAGGEQPQLLLAGDVFIYVGDLQPVFAAAAAAMPRGLFAFTAEELPEGEGGMRLQPSLRYAHASSHLQGLATAHGFRVRALQSEPVRYEQGRSVPGLFVLLERG